MANSCFEKGDYDGAIVHYNDALARLPPRQSVQEEDEDDQVKDTSVEDKGKARQMDADDDEKVGSDNDEGEEEAQREASKLRAVIFANIAACRMKLESWQEAVDACNQSLLDDDTYIKALHRRAQSNEKLGTWTSLTSAQEGLYALPDT